MKSLQSLLTAEIKAAPNQSFTTKDRVRSNTTDSWTEERSISFRCEMKVVLRVKGKQYQKLKTWVDLTHFLMGKYTTWRQSIGDNKAKRKRKKKKEKFISSKHLVRKAM